ncbi:MAG: class I SAM-dependent DNA methyltransferase [Rikenellaceae bacterium]
MTPQELAQMIWNIKEIIRDEYNDKSVDEVILPFTLLRRLDCVMEEYCEKVSKAIDMLPDQVKAYKATEVEKYHNFLSNMLKAQGIRFYNISGFSLAKMLTNPSSLGDNFKTYLEGFSENVKDILYNFTGGKEKGLQPIYETLERKNLLFSVAQEFVTKADLHTNRVDNHTMGTIFEIIIRMSKESTNETAGQYYTPREIVKLLVSLIFCGEESDIKHEGQHFSIYDPCCGTGGMLTVAKDYMQEISERKDMKVYLYGQEINEQTYAICKADVLMKGENADNIKQGDTIKDDKLMGNKFSYMITNPPFGVDWKKIKSIVEKEAELGDKGRFGAGLPDSSDGSLLFLMHMISKMDEGGSRIGIVLNGSPLFNGDAGSGWSNIRKKLLDEDLLDTIVALPKNLFYGTDITTYMWILDNNKPAERKGKVLLINANQPEYVSQLSRSLGKKRYEINARGMEDIPSIYRAYDNCSFDFQRGELVESIEVAKLMEAEDFLFTKVTVERPLRLKYSNWSDKITAFIQNPKIGQGDKDKMLIVGSALQELDEREELSDWDFFKYLLFTKKLKFAAGFIKKIRTLLGETDESMTEVYESPLDKKSPFVVDTDLRDTESIPFKVDIEKYFKREVLKFAPDAWMDRSKDKIGCEFPFTKLFYVYKPLRSVVDIIADIMKLEDSMGDALKNIMEG